MSSETNKDRAIKICLSTNTQHIKDLKLAPALSIAVGKSCDINNTGQVSLF